MKLKIKVYNGLEAGKYGFDTCLPYLERVYERPQEDKLIAAFIANMANGANLLEVEEINDELH